MNTRSNQFASLLAAIVSLVAIGSAHADQHTQQPALTTAQIEAAKTPGDHEAIARYYDDEAAALEKKALAHEAMAKTYRAGGAPKAHSPAMTSHCERLVTQYQGAAKEARALAAEHRAAAAEAGK